MTGTVTPSDPAVTPQDKADRAERSSGRDEADRIEGAAAAKSEDVERDSGRTENQRQD